MAIRTVRIIPVIRAGTRKWLGMVSVSVVVRDGVATAAEVSRWSRVCAVIRLYCPLSAHFQSMNECLLYISNMDVQYNICEWSDGVYNNIAHRWRSKVSCPFPPPLYHGLRAPGAPGPDAAFLVSQNSSALLTVSNVGCMP